MTAASTAAKALTAALAGTALWGAHWRARALSVSQAEIDTATSEQLAALMTDSHQSVSAWCARGETPPEADRRWFWWVAMACPACSTDQAEVHEPLQGWEPTKRGAQERMSAAYAFLGDVDNCPNVTWHYDEDEGEGDTTV